MEHQRLRSILSATSAGGKRSRKVVRKDAGWRTSRYRHVQMSELFPRETCDQAVMDVLVATDVGKFMPKRAEERRQEEHGQEDCRWDEWCLDRGRSLSLFVNLFVPSNPVHLVYCPLSQGTVGSRWELCHGASSPGGRGVALGSVIL